MASKVVPATVSNNDRSPAERHGPTRSGAWMLVGVPLLVALTILAVDVTHVDARMDPATLWDRRLTELALVGAAIAFTLGLHQYGEAQRWRRAERLDQFIEQFETRPLLRLGAATLDWTARRVTLQPGEIVTFVEDDIHVALDIKMGCPADESSGDRETEASWESAARNQAASAGGTSIKKRQHATISPTQAQLRDAFDALLDFFVRLDAALASGLIDAAPAADHFLYWIDRLERMPWHSGAASEMQKYIRSYSNPDAIARLSARLRGAASPRTRAETS